MMLLQAVSFHQKPSFSLFFEFAGIRNSPHTVVYLDVMFNLWRSWHTEGESNRLRMNHVTGLIDLDVVLDDTAAVSTYMC